MTLVIAGCEKNKKDCSDQVFSDKTFEQATKDFYAYQDVNEVIFVDSSGIEYKFKRELRVSNLKTNILKEDCEDGFKQTTFNCDQIIATFIGPDSTKFAFSYFVGFLDNETQFIESKLVDLLSISVYDASVVSNILKNRLNFITSNRGGQIDQLAQNQKHVNFVGNKKILNREFHKTIEQNESKEFQITFNQEFGLIAITNKSGEKLVFDRFVK